MSFTIRSAGSASTTVQVEAAPSARLVLEPTVYTVVKRMQGSPLFNQDYLNSWVELFKEEEASGHAARGMGNLLVTVVRPAFRTAETQEQKREILAFEKELTKIVPVDPETLQQCRDLMALAEQQQKIKALFAGVREKNYQAANALNTQLQRHFLQTKAVMTANLQGRLPLSHELDAVENDLRTEKTVLIAQAEKTKTIEQEYNTGQKEMDDVRNRLENLLRKV